MNKIIPFNKDITFNDKIGEIESIALDDTLKFVNDHTIKGELIVRGCNKYQDLLTDFSYPLPVEIEVDSKYNTEKSSIMVDDFYYEIINDNILRVKIDLILDDLFYNEVKVDKEVRDVPFEEVKINEEETVNTESQDSEVKDTELKNKEEKNDVMDLFKDLDNNEEKEYSIYRVYTVLENDTLNSILEKYKVSREDLEEINDLSNLKCGSKLIIPSIDE